MTNEFSAMEAIAEAVGLKLTGDAPLMALITGVFDFRGIPANQAFPYVTIGEETETDDSTFDTLGYEDTLMLHIWSIQPGAQECRLILKNLNRLLNHQPLALANMSHVGTWYELALTMDDPADTRITHMPVRYRIGAGEN